MGAEVYMDLAKEIELSDEIASVLNRASIENESDTPDFILAQFLLGCLNSFNKATRMRDDWHSFTPFPEDKNSPARNVHEECCY